MKITNYFLFSMFTLSPTGLMAQSQIWKFEFHADPVWCGCLCFRLLLMLDDEELLKPPYSIESQAHRRAILAELDRVKALGVKPPQNLWEYKVRSDKMFVYADVYTLMWAAFPTEFDSLASDSSPDVVWNVLLLVF